MNENEAPKKISADQVEVIGANGEVVKPGESKKTRDDPFQGRFGNIRVIQGSPWLLLLLPIVIPIAIVFFFIIMIFALLFGKSLFKIFRGPTLRPRN